jgi:hypothetical protein
MIDPSAERSQPKGGKLKMRGRKFRSGVKFVRGVKKSRKKKSNTNEGKTRTTRKSRSVLSPCMISSRLL